MAYFPNLLFPQNDLGGGRISPNDIFCKVRDVEFLTVGVLDTIEYLYGTDVNF